MLGLKKVETIRNEKRRGEEGTPRGCEECPTVLRAALNSIGTIPWVPHRVGRPRVVVVIVDRCVHDNLRYLVLAQCPPPKHNENAIHPCFVDHCHRRMHLSKSIFELRANRTILVRPRSRPVRLTDNPTLFCVAIFWPTPFLTLTRTPTT